MSDLSYDDIINRKDQKIKKIYVHRWKGNIYIKEFSVQEKEDWEKYLEGKDKKDILSALVSRAVCDKEGNLLFKEKDIKELNKQSCVAMQQIADEVMKMHQISVEDIERIEKN